MADFDVQQVARDAAIAAHPAFRRCYEDGRLLDAMLAELDGIVVEPTPAPTTVELDSLDPGDRFRVIHEYRVDPAVAVVRDWLDSGRKADARDLVARIDAARADA